jgi:aminopeptidase N
MMLDTLREAVGDEKFFWTCRAFFQTYKGKPTGTPDFRRFWQSKLSGQKNVVDSWLDSRGGLISPPSAGPSSSQMER